MRECVLVVQFLFNFFVSKISHHHYQPFFFFILFSDLHSGESQAQKFPIEIERVREIKRGIGMTEWC